jgi:hypothetical protein
VCVSQEELREERAARLAQDSAPPPPSPPALDDARTLGGAHQLAWRTAPQQPTAALCTTATTEGAAVAAAMADGTLTSAHRVIETIRQHKLVAVHVPDTMLAGVTSLRCVPPGWRPVSASRRKICLSPRAIGARLGHRISRRRGVRRHSGVRGDTDTAALRESTSALCGRNCGNALEVSSSRSTVASSDGRQHDGDGDGDGEGTLRYAAA